MRMNAVIAQRIYLTRFDDTNISDENIIEARQIHFVRCCFYGSISWFWYNYIRYIDIHPTLQNNEIVALSKSNKFLPH